MAFADQTRVCFFSRRPLLTRWTGQHRFCTHCTVCVYILRICLSATYSRARSNASFFSLTKWRVCTLDFERGWFACNRDCTFIRNAVELFRSSSWFLPLMILHMQGRIILRKNRDYIYYLRIDMIDFFIANCQVTWCTGYSAKTWLLLNAIIAAALILFKDIRRR